MVNAVFTIGNSLYNYYLIQLCYENFPIKIAIISYTDFMDYQQLLETAVSCKE